MPELARGASPTAQSPVDAPRRQAYWSAMRTLLWVAAVTVVGFVGAFGGCSSGSSTATTGGGCQTSADCAGASVCDQATKTCKPAGTGPGSTGPGSTGTGGGAGTGGTGGHGPASCKGPADCPMTGNLCALATCSMNVCGTLNAPAGKAPTQVAGNCQQALCNGKGVETTIVDDTNVPVHACAMGTCTNGKPSLANQAAGTACAMGGGTRCDGNGNCVACLTKADCAPPDVCSATNTCVLLGGQGGQGGAGGAAGHGGAGQGGVAGAQGGAGHGGQAGAAGACIKCATALMEIVNNMPPNPSSVCPGAPTAAYKALDSCACTTCQPACGTTLCLPTPVTPSQACFACIESADPLGCVNEADGCLTN